MFTLDFETHRIIKGSDTSPLPVGYSIKHDSSPSYYYAFGHPKNNNCTYTEARNILVDVYSSGEQILCHNSKFDLRIALEHFDLPLPDWSLIVDTMIMAYLIDPREVSLALKDLAEKYCDIPPDDQIELHNWIRVNVAPRHPEAGTEPGAFIARAPGDIVGRYAESDTDMTYALYQYFWHHFDIESGPPECQNIRNAFNREMQLIPIVIDLEQRGLNISPTIHGERAKLEQQFELLNMQLNAYGNGEKPGSKAMFNVLRKKGLIDESKIQYTAKGNPRYGKDFLEDIIADKELVKILALRSRLQKFLSTYIIPFSDSARQYNGKYYPYYNQTRSEDDYGTKTGRFSSNIQQLPKDVLSGDELPFIRSFIIPSKPDRVIIKRDFSGQEMRVTAHYAEGNILQAYIDDPKLDVHSFVENLVFEKTGISGLDRVVIKSIGFLKLYGGGAALLAKRLKIPETQARHFFAAYNEGLPEFKEFTDEVEKLAKAKKPVRTWGGRSYLAEPSKMVDGRMQTYYYKVPNIIIQGGSADMTKEAMIRYHAAFDRRGDLIMSVHDELIVECNERDVDYEMKVLRWAMDEMEGWDVPLRSDGKVGKTLGDMAEYEDE